MLIYLWCSDHVGKKQNDMYGICHVGSFWLYWILGEIGIEVWVSKVLGDVHITANVQRIHVKSVNSLYLSLMYQVHIYIGSGLMETFSYIFSLNYYNYTKILIEFAAIIFQKTQYQTLILNVGWNGWFNLLNSFPNPLFLIRFPSLISFYSQFISSTILLTTSNARCTWYAVLLFIIWTLLTWLHIGTKLELILCVCVWFMSFKFKSV